MTPPDPPSACPQCGGVLDVQRDVTVDEPYFPKHPLRGAPLPRRQRIAAVVAFCNGCEYADEVTGAALAPQRGRRA